MERRETLQLLAAVPLLGLALFLMVKFPVLLVGLSLMGVAATAWVSREDWGSPIGLLISLLSGAVAIFDLQFNDASLLEGAGSGFGEALTEAGPAVDGPNMR